MADIRAYAVQTKGLTNADIDKLADFLRSEGEEVMHGSSLFTEYCTSERLHATYYNRKWLGSSIRKGIPISMKAFLRKFGSHGTTLEDVYE